MGFIRERKLKNGSTRFQAEIRLKGISKSVTAVFDRKTDTKAWIQKVEADIRCGRQQLYSEGRRHTFAEAVERYRKEQTVSVSLECGAKARTNLNKPCHQPAMANGRCRLHGGKSTGSRTKEGRKRMKEANTKHGLYLAERIQARRHARDLIQESRAINRGV